MSTEEGGGGGGGGGDLDDSWSLGSRSSSSITSSAAIDEKQDANGPSSDASADAAAAVYEQEKTTKILAACRAGSIEDLQELAMSKGGFLSDTNRALACESVSTTRTCLAHRTPLLPFLTNRTTT